MAVRENIAFWRYSPILGARCAPYRAGAMRHISRPRLRKKLRFVSPGRSPKARSSPMLCIDLLMMLVQCGGAACAGLGVRGRESDAAIVLSWATGLRLGGTSVRTPPASKTAWSARVLGRRAARASGSESTRSTMTSCASTSPRPWRDGTLLFLARREAPRQVSESRGGSTARNAQVHQAALTEVQEAQQGLNLRSSRAYRACW